MRRRFNPYIVAAGVAIIIVAAAGMLLAGRLLSNPGGDLAGSTWRLTLLNGRAPQASGEPLSLRFEAEQRAGGHAGCNTYGGEYRMSGGSLTISGIFSTMMACADDGLNAQEGEFLRALGSVASYERTTDQLTLKDASGAAVLVFAAA